MQAVGLVLHDQNKIIDKRNVIRVAACAGLILRRRAQCVIKLDDVT